MAVDPEKLTSLIETAGRVLVWSRMRLPRRSIVTLGWARIYLDTSHGPPDALVTNAFNGLVRLIVARSPQCVATGGAPIYIGPHLASRFASGELTPRWPRGDEAKLVRNPRFKKSAPPSRQGKTSKRPDSIK